ncbi:MAG: flavodoxin domain-containing protein [Deltaproteobacteria bacterium]|nr:flavodoxin domain-containing protein [Deltaproteobacteria bacterium]
MPAIEIAKGIYSVGVTDWTIRNFHGYSTHMGTTYNAFLIVDEKIVLIDTVKKEFGDQLLDNIADIVDPHKIDYVISNHTEMDHSGSLPRIMHKIGEDKPIYCSKMGEKNLPLHSRQSYNYRAVKSGEELNIGKKNLMFLETRMLHWPDSMFTYAKEDRILFSSDAFGQHYAGPERFDDQIGDAIMPHAKKYYTNILLPYSALIEKVVENLEKFKIEFDMICPDHGILWRKNPARIINAYLEWNHQKPQKKAIVVFDTMWHSTEMMAEAIVDGLNEEGIWAKPMRLGKWDRSQIITEILDAGAVIVGSPTLNNQILPPVSDFLTYMKGLKPKNKIAAAFGSYGWSGESVKLINDELNAMKFDMIDPGLKIQYVPDQDGIEACIELGRKIGKELNRKC